jgi:hypothetical protein
LANNSNILPPIAPDRHEIISNGDHMARGILMHIPHGVNFPNKSTNCERVSVSGALTVSALQYVD